MTRKTFYRKLRSVAYKFRWEISSSGRRIIAKQCGDTFCPITAVCVESGCGVWAVDEVWKAAEKIGLSDEDAGYIVDLADYGFDDSVGGQVLARKNLEKAVGLTQ